MQSCILLLRADGIDMELFRTAFEQRGQRASQAVQCVGGTEREKHTEVARQFACGKECRLLLPWDCLTWLTCISVSLYLYVCEKVGVGMQMNFNVCASIHRLILLLGF